MLRVTVRLFLMYSALQPTSHVDGPTDILVTVVDPCKLKRTVINPECHTECFLRWACIESINDCVYLCLAMRREFSQKLQQIFPA